MGYKQKTESVTTTTLSTSYEYDSDQQGNIGNFNTAQFSTGGQRTGDTELAETASNNTLATTSDKSKSIPDLFVKFINDIRSLLWLIVLITPLGISIFINRHKPSCDIFDLSTLGFNLAIGLGLLIILLIFRFLSSLIKSK